jgi:hypothetical protein
MTEFNTFTIDQDERVAIRCALVGYARKLRTWIDEGDSTWIAEYHGALKAYRAVSWGKSIPDVSSLKADENLIEIEASHAE